MIKTRFAPSPTGFLHIGGARTALYNWLYAKANGGHFLLRIEDTDEARSTDASTAQILDSLKWLGLDWDEGPFYQSERTGIYREHLERLRAQGAVYPAFETMEELEAMRQTALKEKRNPIYDRASLKLPPEEIERRMTAGVPFMWRFKVPDEGATVIPESLMSDNGEVSFENTSIGDFAITRPGTLEVPGGVLYNFCATVDDALMDITHVIRGVEHLSNTPKQVLIYNALGYAVPTFAHLPLIMKGGKKMSKRDGDADPAHPVSVSARRDLGYMPEATVNFLALLGWSHPDGMELFGVEELLKRFSLERLHRSNANFDEDKYLHHNAWYIRSLPLPEVVRLVTPFLERAGFLLEGRKPEWLEGVVSLEIERCRLLSEFPIQLAYFFRRPEVYEAKGERKFFAAAGAETLLAEISDAVAAVSPFAKPELEAAFRALAEARGQGLGPVSQPVRLALTGRTASPGLWEIMELLGRDETLARLHDALAHVRTLATAGE